LRARLPEIGLAGAKSGDSRGQVGIMPNSADLDLTGLEISPEQLRQVLAVDPAEWKEELKSSGELFARIGSALPVAMRDQHRELSTALARAS